MKNYFLTAVVLIFFLTLWGANRSIAAQDPYDPPDWKRYMNVEARKKPSMHYPYETCFKNAALKYDLPLTLLLAVARGESNFDPKAVSNKNCYGIMQIQWPQTAKHLGIHKRKQLFNPCINIDAGARYLRELMDHYNGDLHRSLAAYNYGPGRIRMDMPVAAIPRGARWYSSYIYDHLHKILKRDENVPSIRGGGTRPDYQQLRQYEIIVFNRPFRAKRFMEYLKKRAPGLHLDWFRTGPGRYRVVLRYQTTEDLQYGKQLMKKAGFTTT